MAGHGTPIKITRRGMHPYPGLLADAPSIHHAAYRGDIAEIHRLVQAGHAVDAVNEYHFSTPLCMARDEATAKTLIALGANVNACNKNQMTPLHYARSEGITRALLNAGATMHTANFHGETPLDYARVSGGGDVYSDVHVANYLVATQMSSSGVSPENKNPTFSSRPLCYPGMPQPRTQSMYAPPYHPGALRSTSNDAWQQARDHWN